MRKAEAESIIGLRGLRRCISVFGVLKEPGIFTQLGVGARCTKGFTVG